MEKTDPFPHDFMITVGVHQILLEVSLLYSAENNFKKLLLEEVMISYNSG